MLILLILVVVHAHAYQSKIANYILNDIDTNVSIGTRLAYDQQNKSNWQTISNLGSQISFPKLQSYLNTLPFFEFIHRHEYMHPSSSITRLSQAH